MSAVWIWTIAGLAVTLIIVLIVLWRWWRADITSIAMQKRKSIDPEITRYKIRSHLSRRMLKHLPSGMDFATLFPSFDDTASRAVRESINKGLLMFNPPAVMIQGHKERVEVRIARSADMREELISGLCGPGEPQFEEIDTTFYMEVKLTGSNFEISSHNPPEQLIIPTPARWEFDLLPCRAGRQAITLSVSMRVEAKGIVGGRRGVSVLEKQIDIRVNIAFAAQRLISNNWQWLIPAVLALAGTVAA
jgi:hypothetical protein